MIEEKEKKVWKLGIETRLVAAMVVAAAASGENIGCLVEGVACVLPLDEEKSVKAEK